MQSFQEDANRIAPRGRPAPGLPTRGRLLRLAGPIVFAQMAFFGMQTTDTIIAGRLGAEVLAAVALGGTLLMIGFTFLIGFGLAVAPSVAHRFGAGAPAAEIAAFNSSAVVFSATLWSLWGLVLWFLPAPVLALLPLDSEVRVQSQGYLQAVALGMPFLGVFFALRNALEGLGHSRPIMWLGFCALLLNIPLDLVLMNGWGPIPALGAIGCGLATALLDAGLAAGMWAVFSLRSQYRPYRPAGRPGLAGMRELSSLGLPIGLALASEHAIFAVGGLLMTRFGTAIMGASQIALNFTGMMFMVALGLGQATSVLVGQAAGAGHAAGVRRAGLLGYQSATLVAVLIAGLTLGFTERIIRWYTQEAEVVAAAVLFLQIAGIFHVFDALQALGAGALRGLKDNAYVMHATTVAYWGVGGLGFVYCFVLRDSPAHVVWQVFVAALATAAILLGLRFYWQARHFEVKYR